MFVTFYFFFKFYLNFIKKKLQVLKNYQNFIKVTEKVFQLPTLAAWCFMNMTMTKAAMKIQNLMYSCIAPLQLSSAHIKHSDILKSILA